MLWVVSAHARSCIGQSRPVINRMLVKPPPLLSPRIPNTLQAVLFRLFVQADPVRSGSIGGTAEEVHGFIDVVMGRRELCARPSCLGQR